MLSRMDVVLDDVGRIAGGCLGKEPEELSDVEKLCLYFMSGAEMEWSSSGMRAARPFGIQKINGQFRVCVSTERR